MWLLQRVWWKMQTHGQRTTWQTVDRVHANMIFPVMATFSIEAKNTDTLANAFKVPEMDLTD